MTEPSYLTHVYHSARSTPLRPDLLLPRIQPRARHVRAHFSLVMNQLKRSNQSGLRTCCAVATARTCAWPAGQQHGMLHEQPCRQTNCGCVGASG